MSKVSGEENAEIGTADVQTSASEGLAPESGGEEIDLKQLAFAIKLRRGKRSLRDVADEAGISIGTISNIENGQMPGLITYARLCRWLDVSLDMFVREAP
jgi:DNA-binding Xre family transcriptional regulator